MLTPPPLVPNSSVHCATATSCYIAGCTCCVQTLFLIYFKVEARQTDRRYLLCGTTRRNSGNRIPFVSTFGLDRGKIANVLRKHWGLLQKRCPTIEEFKAPPLMSYRRAISVKGKLVKADIGSRKPCQGFSCCNNMVRGDKFTHPHSGKVFEIKHRYTCSSMVYIINCPCGLIYVGETTMEVCKRILKHKSIIRKGLADLLIPKHFSDKLHTIGQLKFCVIDSIPDPRRGGDRQAMLRERELMWIHKLDCLSPRGLNLEFKIHNLT